MSRSGRRNLFIGAASAAALVAVVVILLEATPWINESIEMQDNPLLIRGEIETRLPSRRESLAVRRMYGENPARKRSDEEWDQIMKDHEERFGLPLEFPPLQLPLMRCPCCGHGINEVELGTEESSSRGG